MLLGKQKNIKLLGVTPNDDLRRGMTAGADCLERAANYSWWNWDYELRLFFWHWHRCYKKSARGGKKMFIHIKNLPNAWKIQMWPKDTVAINYIFSLIWRCYGPKRDILDYWGTIIYC